MYSEQNCKKITVLSEQLEEIEVQPTTLKTLQIQIVEAPTQTLQIGQVKDEREETKAVIFWRRSLLQSKQNWPKMNALINALLGNKNEAKWLRHEKLDAKLEAVNTVGPLSMTLGNITEPRKKNVFLDSRLFSL